MKRGKVNIEDHRAITEKETEIILGVVGGTLANWRCKGIGPVYFKAGNRSIRYPLAEILAFRDARKVTPGE